MVVDVCIGLHMHRYTLLSYNVCNRNRNRNRNRKSNPITKLTLVLLLLVLVTVLDCGDAFQVLPVQVQHIKQTLRQSQFTGIDMIRTTREPTPQQEEKGQEQQEQEQEQYDQLQHTAPFTYNSSLYEWSDAATDHDRDGPVSILWRRRRLVQLSLSFMFSLSAGGASLPVAALAAAPMTAGEADGLKARLERKIRQKAPKVLRDKLDQDFAVLLMRASYNALDQIDCVAMDQFQRDFFFIRQAEYLPYIEQLGPGIVQQGMLTDPYYFDFISFAQYATISREINNSPASVFQEQQPEKNNNEGDDNETQTFVSTVVRRDPSITNDMLADRHDRLVGKAIIDRLNETFQGTPSALPKIPEASLDTSSILSSLTQLMKLFLVNGFAIDGKVELLSNDSSGTEFCITMTNPANLWSGQALKQSRANPSNSFILKATLELVRRAGNDVVASSVKYEGYQEKSYIKVRKSPVL